jgi:hypothetical protein
MSIKDFSDALRSQAYKAWFQRLSTDNILKTSASDLRANELGDEFNSFYISRDTVKQLLAKLYEADIPNEEVEKVFGKLKQAVYRRGKASAKLISEPYVSGEALYFPRISFDQITSVLNKGFEDALRDNKGKKISDYFQKGHVFGIFPKKVSVISKSLSANTTIDPKSKSLLLGILADLEKQLLEEDLATSNLKTSSFELYAKYAKKPSKYLVELQLKEVNEAAGRSQVLISKALRKFFNPGAVTFSKDGGIKFSAGAGEQRLQEIAESNAKKLLGAKGSPSYLELLEAYMADIIRNGKARAKEPNYSIPLTKVGKTKSSKIDTSEYTKKVKEDLTKVKKLKAEISSLSTRQPSKPQITSLQTILDAYLVKRVKENMQTETQFAMGSRKLLTDRTGRFAESVEVKRLTESRSGMVTAFYTYMKNPYATFSAGGRMERPKTRDPKLLISRSIREIAAQNAYNNLRAINV